MTSDNDPLVSTEWLAIHLGNSAIRIIDASYKMPGVTPLPAEDFLTAHIPGAVFFDVGTIADPDDQLPHMYPNEAQFARDVAKLGISNDNLVIAYDAGGWVAAPRAWWMFKSFGHENVKVLDGGLKKWRQENRPLQSGAASPAPGQFSARLDRSKLRNKQQLMDNLATHREQLIDARARNRFSGAAPDPWPGRRAGHIPGSLNLPYSELFDTTSAEMKSVAELRTLFAKEGLDLQRPVVTTCGSGVSAAVLTLALDRLGVSDSALYDGSWAEWGLADGPPIATGE